MSCILFVCFDSLRGYYQSSLVHLQSGLNILRNLKDKPSVDDNIIKSIIVPIFERLTVQIMLYGNRRAAEEKQALADYSLAYSAITLHVQERFPCLDSARTSLITIADRMFTSFSMYEDLIAEEQTRASFDQHKQHLESWNDAFERLMHHQGSTFNEKQIRGGALCKIHFPALRLCESSVLNYVVPPVVIPMSSDPSEALYEHYPHTTLHALKNVILSKFKRKYEYLHPKSAINHSSHASSNTPHRPSTPSRLATSVPLPERSSYPHPTAHGYDRFSPQGHSSDPSIADYQTIITLSRSLVPSSSSINIPQSTTTSSTPSSTPPNPRFSTDLSIIGPLYHVCITCPVPKLRHEALELIFCCPRREGLWDSVTTAKVIRSFWEVEDAVRNKGVPIAMVESMLEERLAIAFSSSQDTAHTYHRIALLRR